MGAHVAAVAHVKMAGEEKVYVELLEFGEGAAGAADDSVRARPRWGNEGVVGDDDAERARRRIAGTQLDVHKLLLGNLSVFPKAVPTKRDSPRGIDADDQQFIVAINGAQVGGDVAAVAAQRGDQAAE